MTEIPITLPYVANESRAMEKKMHPQVQLPSTKSPESLKRSCGQYEEAAREFVSVFYYKMIQAMHENIEPDALTGGGEAEKMFQGMLHEQYSIQMAQRDSSSLVQAVAYDIARNTPCQAAFDTYQTPKLDHKFAAQLYQKIHAHLSPPVATSP